MNWNLQNEEARLGFGPCRFQPRDSRYDTVKLCEKHGKNPTI